MLISAIPSEELQSVEQDNQEWELWFITKGSGALLNTQSGEGIYPWSKLDIVVIDTRPTQSDFVLGSALIYIQYWLELLNIEYWSFNIQYQYKKRQYSIYWILKKLCIYTKNI